MTRQINSEALDLIKRYEGLRLEAYTDEGGVWTIGWGHTGADVVEGLKITEEQANNLLMQDLARFEAFVETRAKAPSDDQFGAMVSLAFNIGEEGFATSSALRRHNEGNFAAAAADFLLWDKGEVDGRLVPIAGLAARRDEERKLYLKGSPMPDVSAKTEVNLSHVGAAGTAATSATAMLATVLAYQAKMPADVASSYAGLIVMVLGSVSGLVAVLVRKWSAKV